MIKFIKSLNKIFILFAIVHFILVFFLQYKINFLLFNTEQKFWYITVKVITLILLILIWQLISIAIKGFKNQDKKIKDITKYFLIYFIPNLIILFLTWPGGYYIESISILTEVLNYNLHFFTNWLHTFYVMAAYNCIPSMGGISLFNIFIFSLIIAFIVYGYKSIFNNKFAPLIFIPFFLPMVLSVNTLPIRLVNGAYLAVLVFCSILFLYKTKEKTNKMTLISIALAILCSIYTEIRLENTAMLLIFPLMIYLLKLFDVKRFIIFSVSFFIFFFSAFSYQEIRGGLVYSLHNLIIDYNNICNMNTLYSLNEKETNILKDTQCLQKNSIEDKIFNIPVSQQKEVRKIVSKYLLLNIPVTFKLHLNEYLKSYPFLYLDYFIYCETEFQDSSITEWFKKNSKFINEDLRYKTYSYILTGTPNFKSIDKYVDIKLSNVIIPFFLMICILIAGIFQKNWFYILFVLSQFLMLISLFSSIPFMYYFYTYPFTLCTYCIFMTVAASFCKFIFYKYLNYKK